MKLTLLPGETKTQNLQGSQFYFESGTGKIKVEFRGGEAREYELSAGQGFFVSNGGRFNGLEITNLDASVQNIDFDISDGNKFDNRAKIDTTGVMNVKVVQGAKPTSRTFPAVITLAAGVAQQILGVDLTRAKANIYFSALTYLGADNTVNASNGYPINAGSDMGDENTAALWAFSPTGGTVNLMIEVY